MDHQEEDLGYDGGEREETEVPSIFQRRTSLPQAIQLDFSKANITTSHYSSSYELDDEVFIEFEGWQGSRSFTQSQIMSGEMKGESCRSRRTSDVIDSLGTEWPDSHDMTNRLRRTTSPDLRDTVHQFRSQSPLTPRSDGYWSGSVTSVSSPLEPKWFRYSQSHDSPDSISRQGSTKSDTGPNITLSNSDEVSLKSTVKPRSSTTGEEENIKSSRKADTVDSKPSECTPQPPTPTRPGFEVRETLAPVSKDSYEYNMSHRKRGVAIIFNHEIFRTASLPARQGSKQDLQSLHELYNILGFEVRIYNDLSAQQIYDELYKLSQEDHQDHDCVCVTVLTHGLDGDYLYAYDHPYAYFDIYNIFSANNCLSLAGKPKIFIFQACRGKKVDVGVRLMSRTHTDSGDSTQNSSYTIPNMVDFLIANSTFGGYYSWRNPEDGTWYIQSLVRILKEQHENVDLLTMMTRVSCTVATQYESFDDTRPDLSGLKQAPSLVSTLIRQIYFKPKTLIPPADSRGLAS